MGCTVLVVALGEAGKDTRASLGKCQGIQPMIFLLVLPGMCLSTTTKAAAETPRAPACPVLLLLAEVTSKKARNWSKALLQEATNTPTPPGACFPAQILCLFWEGVVLGSHGAHIQAGSGSLGREFCPPPPCPSGSASQLASGV